MLVNTKNTPRELAIIPKMLDQLLMDKRVGNALKALRKNCDLSQKDMAKKIGWAQADVSRLETGKNQITLEKIRQAAKFFGVSVSVVLGETKPRQTELSAFPVDDPGYRFILARCIVELRNEPDFQRQSKEERLEQIMGLYRLAIQLNFFSRRRSAKQGFLCFISFF